MDNIEIVQKLYEHFAQKDDAGIRQILDKNIIWNQMKGFPGGGQFTGIATVMAKVFGGFRKDWDNWTATITRYIDIGDGVIAIGYYEGVYSDTGKYMKADFACEYKIQLEKIVAFQQYTDTFIIARAMGLTAG